MGSGVLEAFRSVTFKLSFEGATLFQVKMGMDKSILGRGKKVGKVWEYPWHAEGTESSSVWLSYIKQGERRKITLEG